MNKKACVALLVVLLIAATTVAARRGPFGHRRGPGGPGGLGKLMFIADRLDLTDEQFLALRKQMKTTREEARPLMEQMHLLKKQIIESIDTETFEENKIREIIELKSKVMAELAILHLKKVHEFRKELTPEQLEKIRTMLKRRGPFCPHKEED